MGLDEQRERVCEDLRGVVRGELLFDDISRALYSTDASIYQVQPLGVIVPIDEEDVQNVVRYAAEHHIPITGRGAGSGLAGESLSAGLILDFSRHFRQIRDIGADTVAVQPGVVYRELNRRLSEVGRRFAPDTASGAQCTIGGMIANNASGARALKYGYTRDYVLGLRAIFDNGDVDNLAQEPRRQEAQAESRKNQILSALIPLLEQNADLIRACQPRTRFNRCGYLLHDVLTPDALNLGRLVVGSEGTLALFTEAKLRTIPLPADRGLVLLGFGSVEAAAKAVQRCLPHGPSACELLDRRLLTLAREAYPEYGSIVSSGTEAVLLVEFESESRDEASTAARGLLRQFREREQLAAGILATTDAEIKRLWRLRDVALPMLYSLPGHGQPIAFIEDVGIPSEQLALYLHRVQEILQRHQTTASFLVHAGAGQVHTRPFLDLHQPENVQKLRSIADEVYDVVLALGGTISTQHGVGLARTPWVSKQYGRLFQLFREVKAIFDPNNLLNPGKIIAANGDPLDSHLRRSAVAESVKPNGHVPILGWRAGEIEGQCRSCNGCGVCRTEEPARRMCPLFRVHHTEAATPRAKANLLRALLGGTLDAERLSSEEVREVADLCVNCKMCALECPALVNIPKLMLETKAAHFAEHGLSRRDWVLARAEGFAVFGSTFAPVVNAVLQSRGARWFLERILGVSRRRRLPRFARRSFLHVAARRGWSQRRPETLGTGSALGANESAFPPRRVAYFVDIYANYNDPQVAEAAVAVLQHNGIEVYVPPGQVGCGMAPLAYGDVKTAKRLAEQNLRVLGDLARAGYTIVCSEPTAALMLRRDYLDLIDDPDTRLVAERTTELTAFLWGLHREGRLRADFQALDFAVGHHVPCHLKALQMGIAGPQLLALIPGMRTHTIDVSCSGMAGTFGLQADNFADSLAAGEPMLQRLRQDDLLFGSSECSACRMQMEHGARKRSLHPVQYLALAYGLMPEIAERLRAPIRKLVLR